MKAIKGQAAMEYLFTYSWAFVAIGVVFALLIASGVFSPSKYNQDYCIGAGIDCLSIFAQGNEVVIRLRNNMGFDIEVNGIDVFVEGRGANRVQFQLGVWSAGEVRELRIEDNNIRERKLNRLEVSFRYSPCDDGGCVNQAYEITHIVYVTPQG